MAAANSSRILLFEWQRGSEACDLTLQHTPKDAVPGLRLAMSSVDGALSHCAVDRAWTDLDCAGGEEGEEAHSFTVYL